MTAQNNLSEESRIFRTTASRLMHCNCDTFDDRLARVLYLIDNSSLIDTLFNDDAIESYDVETALNIPRGHQLKFSVDVKTEASQIYALLKALSTCNKDIRDYTFDIYRHTKFQENLDEFQEIVIQPLIDHVNNAYLFAIERNATQNAKQSQAIVVNGDMYGNVENYQSAGPMNVRDYSRDDVMAKIHELEEKLNSLEDSDARDVGAEAIASIRANLDSEQPAKKKIKAAMASLGTLADIATLGTTIMQLISMLSAMLTH